MEEFFNLALSTFLLRPYVFAFLLVYLILSYNFFGWRRAILYTLTAWIIAYISEISSINIGIPYGDYKYTYFTKVFSGDVWNVGEKELFVFGLVPFIDSLSYTFISFTGYILSVYLFSPVKIIKSSVITLDTYNIRHSLRVAIIGALIVTFMDVIIDPVATVGWKWFLGEIHYYVTPGYYFGVPISNFAGWYITSFLIILSFQQMDKILLERDYYQNSRTCSNPYRLPMVFGLYLGIIGFNIFVAAYIGEFHMAISGLLIQIPIITFLIMPFLQRKQQGDTSDIQFHLQDFPEDSQFLK